MAPGKPKSKKKPMTLDDFAVLIQRDLARMATKDDIAAIRAEMATKDDLSILRSEMNSEIRSIRADMATKKDLAKVHEELDNKISDLAIRITDVKEELIEKIEGLKYAKEIDELRGRVNTIEEKLGMRSRGAGRAA